jgi:gliding motility-associated-like protein
VPGDQITVEAKFNRITPYPSDQTWAGDLVSKHNDPTDVNYLLRPNGAEITTSHGYFKTPNICDIELNKTYQVAMVYDGHTLKFYRDGFLMSQVSATGTLYQNSWKTRIGIYEPMFHHTNFVGYIDEVRIWNVARTQQQIRTYMNTSLPSPTTQPNLLAYYTFDDLQNKQGNASYNLTLSTFAEINSNPDCNFVADSCSQILQPPDSVIITHDTTICAGIPLQLNTVPGLVYQWSPSMYLDNPHSANPTTTTPTDITYYVDAYVPDFDTTLRDSIKIKVHSVSVNTIEDTTLCSGNKVQLTSSGAASYLWSPSNGLSATDIASPVAQPAGTTTYTVTGRDQFGCEASDAVQITIIPSPQIDMIPDSFVCRGATVQLWATGGTTYKWSPAAGLSDENIADPTATINVPKMYGLEVKGANGCTSKDSVKFTIRPVPNFQASENKSICSGDAVTLSASGGDRYKWTSSQFAGEKNSAAISLSPTISAWYHVAIEENVCHYDTSFDINVAVNPLPEVSATKSNDITCKVPFAQLEARGAISYAWSPAAAVNNANIWNPVATTDSTTTYVVTGTNIYGCSSSASVSVLVSKDDVASFEVPNAFTPNNDGKNDCFQLTRWGNAYTFDLAIYNRWGQLLFHTNNASACWNGQFQGVAQPAGGYIYVMKASTFCGMMFKKGVVTLIR